MLAAIEGGSADRSGRMLAAALQAELAAHGPNEKRVDAQAGKRKRFSSAILPGPVPTLAADFARCFSFVSHTACPPRPSRPRLEKLLRHGGGPVGLSNHSADRAVTRRVESLCCEESFGHGALKVRVV